MNNTSIILRKFIMIFVGSVISAFGITLAMYAGFGSATLAVLWQGVSRTLNITIGQASWFVAVVMIVFGIVYDRHQIGIGTVLYQMIYGYFVDVFGTLHRYPDNKILCFIIMCIGVVFFAIGTGIYAGADWGRGSYDILSFAIAEKKKWQIRYVRMGVDVAVVVIGMLLGGTGGLCTLITILFAGNVIQWTIKLVHTYEK